MKKIPIPHLNYNVYFTNKKNKDMPGPCCERIDNSRCNIHVPCNKVGLIHSATIAHEAMHACQFIAQDRTLDMISEQEHMGYIMQYIMREIYGFQAETI